MSLTRGGSNLTNYCQEQRTNGIYEQHLGDHYKPERKLTNKANILPPLEGIEKQLRTRAYQDNHIERRTNSIFVPKKNMC